MDPVPASGHWTRRPLPPTAQVCFGGCQWARTVVMWRRWWCCVPFVPSCARAVAQHSLPLLVTRTLFDLCLLRSGHIGVCSVAILYPCSVSTLPPRRGPLIHKRRTLVYTFCQVARHISEGHLTISNYSSRPRPPTTCYTTYICQADTNAAPFERTPTARTLHLSPPFPSLASRPSLILACSDCPPPALLSFFFCRRSIPIPSHFP